MVESTGTGTGNGNGASAAKEYRETFRQWLDQYQRDQEIQNHNINQLTRDVAALTSTVQSLIDNQKGLFSKANRPLQWGAIGTAFGLLIMMVGLVIAPMQTEDQRQRNFDKDVMVHLIEDGHNMGALEERTRWLMRQEERNWIETHNQHVGDPKEISSE